ncbi:MAG: DnaA/Hda family protein [Alphaproteobacteria bacterium]|nr:DnaA/Hda family protein [Alphaproteobacteria bacterium]
MIKPLQQIPFDWGARSAQGREDFLIGPANRDAVAWIDRWPDWPAPCLIIHGPAACGKSHLAAVWAEQAQAVSIKAEALMLGSAEILADASHHAVIDGLDPWIGTAEAETTLFHLYNLFREEKRSLLLTMRMSPTQAPFALPDLASRMRAAPAAQIQPPDDDLLSSLLVKLFHDRQIEATPDMIRYVLPRMERSFVAAHHLIDAADRMALAQKRPVSITLLRDVLARI